uniref:Membrane protein, palmitoylated 4-like n=1 Tax=Neogobius melanostomus TaxID=47308 RepID=A0A8C6S4S0_9GOBI
TKTSPAPTFDSASGLSLQLLAVISSKPYVELCFSVGFQAVLSAHDSVAQKDYEPVLPALPEDLPDDEEATRIVCLVKNKQPLGATIKRNEMTGEIFVARVIHGGLADRSGLLHAGDRIMEVNGFSVDGLEPEQVIQACSQGTIMFKVVPITERAVHCQTMMFVRAMADYNPQLDPAIPCPDAGVTFAQGDILEIVDQTDSMWWQAKKLPSSSACAGLVPSTELLKRKQREHWWSQPYQPHALTAKASRIIVSPIIKPQCFSSIPSAPSQSSHCPLSAGFRRSLRLCRRRIHSHVQPPACQTQCLSSCCYSALCSPYEEVVRYQRNPRDPLRLVALMGASGVGVNELRRRLIDTNPQLFQGAIPCTSRPPRDYEEPRRDYHFVSRDVFEKMIHDNKFVEYGEYKGNYYGTSSESVMEVLTNGKICVMDIEPSALQAVRTPDLRAYVIYIKPPSAEYLRKTRHSAQILTHYYATRPFKDDFLELEEAAQKMELHFSQFFDHVVINEELQESCIQLWSAATRAQDQPQWVPASWIRPQQETHMPQ